MTLSNEQARQFLIRYQQLDNMQPAEGKPDILAYVKKVGCIQYDPLNVVGRNADLVLQSRINNYKPDQLAECLYTDRTLIDSWDKVMSIYRTDDWPYFERVRALQGEEVRKMLKKHDTLHALDYIDEVLEALDTHGPLQARQIGKGQIKGNWGYQSNIYNVTLDYLFHIGKVGVSNKLNVNKVFDRIEKLVPAAILNQPLAFATEADYFKWLVNRRIGSIGMIWNRSGGGWYGTGIPDKKARQQAFDDLVATGEVTKVQVEGITDPFYVKTADIQSDWQTPATAPDVKFIAPLDNLIWDRDIISRLFAFDYTWEVYVPEAKRKYGYYVLPVLLGNQFIARFEPQKSATHLCIKNWWWEPHVAVTAELKEQVMQAMARFAVFLSKPQGVDEGVYTKL